MEPQARRGGYAGLTWPKEFGGVGRAVQPSGDLPRGACARGGAVAPRRDRSRHGRADDHVAGAPKPSKERYLSKILSAEEIWCQGFSEPDAGSDLAAVRTRIEDKGDHFLVNGQKVWSSFAHIADYCILVGLGLPDEPRYKNLTYVIVDMHAPGVEVRPLMQITGHPSSTRSSSPT